MLNRRKTRPISAISLKSYETAATMLHERCFQMNCSPRSSWPIRHVTESRRRLARVHAVNQSDALRGLRVAATRRCLRLAAQLDPPALADDGDGVREVGMDRREMRFEENRVLRRDKPDRGVNR